MFCVESPSGAIPTSDKAEARGIGSEICSQCKAAIKIVRHLFRDCPGLDNSGSNRASFAVGLVRSH